MYFAFTYNILYLYASNDHKTSKSNINYRQTDQKKTKDRMINK